MISAIDFAALTDVGLRRSNNEDSHAVLAAAQQNTYIVILADGMGAHQSGELASSIAVRYVRERLSAELSSPMDISKLKEVLEEIMEKANVKVYLESLSEARHHNMGSTLSTAVICQNKMLIGHIGDCRSYVLRGQHLIQLTTDHTLVQMLVDRGEMSPEMAMRHSRRNEVTRALGSQGFVKADIIEAALLPGDRLLFSTDGLHDYVVKQDIFDILNHSSSPNEAVVELVQKANDTAGVDNVTCIVGFVR